jgi:hypothetical protein
MRTLFIGLLVVAAIVIGGGFIANEAYQAGLHTAVTTAAANAPAGTVVTPVVPGGYGYPYGYGYGPGWGHGFSIFGFLGTLLFIFIIVGLLRAAFWRGRGWGAGGWGGGYGKWGPGGPGRWANGEHDPRSRFHQTFEDWHRESHAGSSVTGESSSTGSTPPTSGGTASS